MGPTVLATEAFIDRGEGLADWLECLALCRGSDALSRREIDDIAVAAGVAEGDVDIARGIVARRERTWGGVYPFRLVAGGVRGLPGACASPWAVMLLMSPHVRPRWTGDLDDVSAVFENLVARALAGLFGEGGSAVEFGYRGGAGGRPADFPGAVRWLAELMGVEPGAAYRPPARKDGGVDVVAWRSFPDRRGGFPMMLVQCTVGRDVLGKAHDVDTRLWCAWLGLDHDPLTALAFPFVVDGRNTWDQVAIVTKVLDRGRLATLLGPWSEAEAEPWVLAQLEDWRAGLE